MIRHTKSNEPIAVDAQQWFKNGDHSKDNRWIVNKNTANAFLSEGAVVRYYRHPEVPGTTQCPTCETPMHNHGWIDTGSKGAVVCPGDWIITEKGGNIFPLNPKLFAMFYESPSEATSARREDRC